MVLVDKQLRSYYESMGKEGKIGSEAFRWARAKVFNYNKTLLFGMYVRKIFSADPVAQRFQILRTLAELHWIRRRRPHDRTDTCFSAAQDQRQAL